MDHFETILPNQFRFQPHSKVISSVTIDTICSANSNTISKAISDIVTDSNPDAISDNFLYSTWLQYGGVWQQLWEAVCEHLSSQYIANVGQSIITHIFKKMLLGGNACHSSAMVNIILDARDQ